MRVLWDSSRFYSRVSPSEETRLHAVVSTTGDYLRRRSREHLIAGVGGILTKPLAADATDIDIVVVSGVDAVLDDYVALLSAKLSSTEAAVVAKAGDRSGEVVRIAPRESGLDPRLYVSSAVRVGFTHGRPMDVHWAVTDPETWCHAQEEFALPYAVLD